MRLFSLLVVLLFLWTAPAAAQFNAAIKLSIDGNTVDGGYGEDPNTLAIPIYGISYSSSQAEERGGRTLRAASQKDIGPVSVTLKWAPSAPHLAQAFHENSRIDAEIYFYDSVGTLVQQLHIGQGRIAGYHIHGGNLSELGANGTPYLTLDISYHTIRYVDELNGREYEYNHAMQR